MEDTVSIDLVISFISFFTRIFCSLFSRFFMDFRICL